MATWPNWKNQLLGAANILPTPPIYTFLDSWASHAHSSCGNNPIDLSVKVGNAVKCANNTGIHATTWRYASQGDAAAAFNQEIHQSWAKPLLDALNTGNPFQIDNPSPVESVLISWGSDEFASVYAAAWTGKPGSGSGGGKVDDAQALKGWNAIRKSFNQTRKHHMQDAHRLDAASLRALKKASKVRL